MKSNVRKIMEEKGITIRALMAKIDELFPRTKKNGEMQTTAMATIVKARTDPNDPKAQDKFGIEGCTLLTLKMIARALEVSISDLFSDSDQPNKE